LEVLSQIGSFFLCRVGMVEIPRVAMEGGAAVWTESLRERCGDCVGEAGQPVDHRDHDVADTSGHELVHHLETELGPRSARSTAQHFLLALAGDRQRQIDRLVAAVYPDA